MFGSDLDIRVIKGYGVGRKTKNKIEGMDKIEKFDIRTNFDHYKLPRPEFWVQDFHRPMIKPQTLFDAIVCDPPYGVRARTHKVGIAEKKADRYDAQKKDEQLAKVAEANNEASEFRACMKEQYAQRDIYQDLLAHGAVLLR